MLLTQQQRKDANKLPTAAASISLTTVALTSHDTPANGGSRRQEITLCPSQWPAAHWVAVLSANGSVCN